MWLQESPPALSSTPPIDFPSCRSVSLNHFIQGDPPSPSTLDRLICALLAGFSRAMTFIHLSMYILPDCMVPSLINSQCTPGSMAPSNVYSMHATEQCSLSKKRNSVWFFFSPPDLRSVCVNMWPNIMLPRCYLCHIIISTPSGCSRHTNMTKIHI